MYVTFVSYGCCKTRSGDVAHVAIISEVCFICVFLTHVQIALRTPHEKPGFLDKSRRSDQTLRRAMRLGALSWDRHLTEPSHRHRWWWWWKIPIWFSLSVADDEATDNTTSWLAKNRTPSSPTNWSATKWAPSRSEHWIVRSTGRILHYGTS